MTQTNAQSGTRIDEIAEGIYRINTPFPDMPGGFSFNQYLVVDDEPLIFHTGGRKLFPYVREAIETVLPIAKLRWIAFSHVESDECGGLNQLIACAPNAQPMCSMVAAMVSMTDLSDSPPRPVMDGETISIGKRTLQWFDTPHLPHGWESGALFDTTTRTLFCGDLFTQPGAETPPITEGDILGPSEAFRQQMDYFAHSKNQRALIMKLAATKPATLACMHGSAWRGDGAALLTSLAEALG